MDGMDRALARHGVKINGYPVQGRVRSDPCCWRSEVFVSEPSTSTAAILTSPSATMNLRSVGCGATEDSVSCCA